MINELYTEYYPLSLIYIIICICIPTVFSLYSIIIDKKVPWDNTENFAGDMTGYGPVYDREKFNHNDLYQIICVILYTLLLIIALLITGYPFCSTIISLCSS